MQQLPIYKIKGNFYFLDKRLGENSFPELEKPNQEDIKTVWG